MRIEGMTYRIEHGNCLKNIYLDLKGKAGRRAVNNRDFIDAVFQIIRTGSPWRDLPPDYGGWKNTHRRFARWSDKGVWEMLLNILMDEILNG